jgi:hypothetical protein
MKENKEKYELLFEVKTECIGLCTLRFHVKIWRTEGEMNLTRIK